MRDKERESLECGRTVSMYWKPTIATPLPRPYPSSFKFVCWPQLGTKGGADSVMAVL